MTLPIHPPRPFATVTALAAVLLVTGATACGGSDDGPAAATDRQSDRAGLAPADDGAPRASTGDEQGGGAAAPQERAIPQPSDPVLTGDRGQARAGAEAVDRMYEGLFTSVGNGIAATDVHVGSTLEAADGNSDLTAACESMSAPAQRETIVYAKRSAGLAGIDWTCEKAMALMLRRAKQAGGLERTLDAELVGVNAEGKRATATVRFGSGRKARTSTVSLVNEDGEWKLAAAPSPQDAQ
jgi:hypothetical protein